METYILIPAYEYSLLDDCLKSIHETVNDKNIQILIAYNSSRIGGLHGFSKTCNILLKAALNDPEMKYAILCSKDVEVQTKNWLGRFKDKFNEDSGIGMIGGQESLHDDSGWYYLIPHDEYPYYKRSSEPYSGDAFEVVYPAFAFVAITRLVLEVVGLLDENYGQGYYEDYCLFPDTLIAGQYDRIDGVKYGDSVISHGGLHTNVEETFTRNYNGEVIRLKAMGMLPITCTPDHPIMVAKNISKWSKRFDNPRWCRAADIVTYKDYVVLPRLRAERHNTYRGIKSINLRQFTCDIGFRNAARQGYPTKFPLNYDTAWFMGLYVAEGCVTAGGKQLNFTLNNNENEIQDKLMKIISDMGYSPQFQQTAETYINIRLASKILARAFPKWFGRRAGEKRIPEFIMNHRDKNFISQFIKGYLEGDGCISHDNRRGNSTTIIANTRSKVLALQLQLLAAKLGIFLNIYPINKGHMYRFKIGKRDYTSYVNNGFGLGSSDPSLIELMGGTRMSGGRPKMRSVVKKDYIYTKVTGVERHTYNGQIYNLKTASGTFLANNITVHNCLGIRAWLKGYKSLIDPSVIFHHVRGVTMGSIPGFYPESQAKYHMEKWGWLVKDKNPHEILCELKKRGMK